jgi:hypothetical protein
MLKHLLTICSFLLLISSCKKDDDDNNDPTAITKENLSANYKMVSGVGKLGLLEIDVMNNDDFFDACQRDDIITLKQDFTYTTTDAGVTCTPSTTEDGVWALPNTSTIIIDGETFTILSFNGTELKIGYKENTSLGDADITLTLRKQ